MEQPLLTVSATAAEVMARRIMGLEAALQEVKRAQTIEEAHAVAWAAFPRETC